MCRLSKSFQYNPIGEEQANFASIKGLNMQHHYLQGQAIENGYFLQEVTVYLKQHFSKMCFTMIKRYDASLHQCIGKKNSSMIENHYSEKYASTAEGFTLILK